MYKKKEKNIWNVDVDDIVISKLIETKNNKSKYLIGCLMMFWHYLKWVDMLKGVTTKTDRIITNWCLSIKMMISYSKSTKPSGLRSGIYPSNSDVD